ncbi:atrial natriuretic peptide receptor 3-like [Physella acuta]|uniref:atrial natriuretic peptide receptor 3-like n=1 Tax=Physella acuta TaxID=109671 RepID=UPI0027DE0A04|nr:atrial natriuretic peptide receptor 3-like [Physella acuta]
MPIPFSNVLIHAFLLWTTSLGSTLNSTDVQEARLVSVDSPMHIFHLAILLPYDKKYFFSIPDARPAIEHASSHLHEYNISTNITLALHYADTNCSEKDAPLAVFNNKRTVHAFLGPFCDYSLAPSARYLSVWNLPVISPGGFSHSFKLKEKGNFTTLTRVGWTLDSLSTFLHKTVTFYHWKKIFLLYDGNIADSIMPKFCYLAASAITHLFRGNNVVKLKMFMILNDGTNHESTFRHEIGIQHSGE